MSIETLDDIVEEMADRMEVYGEDRSELVSDLLERIRQASEVERLISNRERELDEMS